MIHFPLSDYVEWFPDVKDRGIDSFADWFQSVFTGHAISYFNNDGVPGAEVHESPDFKFRNDVRLYSILDLMANPSDWHVHDDSDILVINDIPMNDLGDEFQLFFMLHFFTIPSEKIYIVDTTDPKVYAAFEPFWAKAQEIKKYRKEYKYPMTCYFFDGDENLTLADNKRFAVIDLNGRIGFDDPTSTRHQMPDGIIKAKVFDDSKS